MQGKGRLNRDRPWTSGSMAPIYDGMSRRRAVHKFA